MIKLAIIRIRKYFLDNKLDAYLVSTVHDEIIYEISEQYGMDTIQQVAEDIRQIMRNAGKEFLEDIPIDIEYSIAKCWKK